MGPSGVREDGEATLVEGNLVRNRWVIFATLNLDVPYVKCVKNYQRRKKNPNPSLYEALGMEMRLPPLCEHSVPHTLPSGFAAHPPEDIVDGP